MVLVKKVKCKICLIGDWGVGKTSLIRKYVLDQYDDSYLTTLGTKASKKHIIYNNGGKKITNLTLQIWDVMGQKEFNKIQKLAFRGTQAAFIVCDITRKDTLDNLMTWKLEIFEIADDIPIIILANKYDLLDQAEFTLEDLNTVTKKLKADSFFTSAKTGENVENAFTELGSKLI